MFCSTAFLLNAACSSYSSHGCDDDMRPPTIRLVDANTGEDICNASIRANAETTSEEVAIGASHCHATLPFYPAGERLFLFIRAPGYETRTTTVTIDSDRCGHPLPLTVELSPEA